MESTSSTETVTSTSEIVLYGEVNDTTVDITVIQVKNTLLYLTSRYDNNKQVITKILSHRSFLSAEGEQNYIYYAISSSGLVTELIQERLG